MKKQFAVLILVLTSLAYSLAAASSSLAQEQTQHPIDKALEACIEKNGSTARHG
jgi:ABC-type transporter MlaC component